MKLLVFSDIHGNDIALEQFIEDKEQIHYDKVIFLGDIFGYYYNQKSCFRLLKDISNLIWLKGNHDDYAVKSYYGEVQNDYLIAAYGHSYASIKNSFDEEEILFLSKLGSSYILETDGKTIGLFHGRPCDPLEGRIYSDTELKEDEFNGFDIVIIGHTHCRIDRRIGKTRILSPGALGQPRDGKGYGYLIVDTITENCEFKNVSVDNNLLKIEIDKWDKGFGKLYDVLSRETDGFKKK